jgi:hypothetical protein
MRRLALLSPVTLAGVLLAQGTIVSPPGLDMLEGNASNTWPLWGDVPRYMQIHGDLGSTPRALRQLAFRLNGNAAAYPGPRVLDAELVMGNSVPWDRPSWIYANNWVGTPVTVMARTTVNLQNLTGGAGPTPFDAKFPFSTPFVYTAQSSIAWDLRAHSNTGTGGGPWDAHWASAGTGGLNATIGTGCTASGQSAPMLLGGSHADYSGIFNMGWYVNRGPANAPTVLAFGTTNPNLSVPGLCDMLYTNLQIVLPMGSTDATGFLGERFTATTVGPGGRNAWALPNTFPTAIFFLQAHSLDAGSTNPIPISSTHGRQVTVPTSNLTTVVRVTRLYHFNGGGNATYPNAFHVTGSVGCPLVTQFTY